MSNSPRLRSIARYFVLAVAVSFAPLTLFAAPGPWGAPSAAYPLLTARIRSCQFDSQRYVEFHNGYGTKISFDWKMLSSPNSSYYGVSAMAISAGRSVIDWSYPRPNTWLPCGSDVWIRILNVKGVTSTPVVPPQPPPDPPLTHKAEVISLSVPGFMLPRTWYNVRVSMRNRGSAGWAAGKTFLASLNNDWAVENTDRFLAPLPKASNDPADPQRYDFEYRVKSPAGSGTYRFQWQIYQDDVGYFGEVTPPRTVVVANERDSEIISVNGPRDDMSPGEQVGVLVSMRNIGLEPWRMGDVRLKPRLDLTEWPCDWGIPLVDLPLPSADPNDPRRYDFYFQVRAPQNAQRCDFAWQLFQDHLGYFGEVAHTPASLVRSNYESEIISSEVPATMIAGKPYAVRVSYRNTGRFEWAQGDTRLKPRSSQSWGIVSVSLPVPRSGAEYPEYDFTFNVVAPGVPGQYVFAFGLHDDRDGTFGPTLSKTLTVVQESSRRRTVRH